MRLNIPKPASAAGWAVAVLAALLTLIGVTLVLGGLYLATLGGSWYYFIAGAGLLGSAWYLLQRRLLGAWIFVAIFVFTLLWALSEAHLDGWALLPRLLGPFVLLAAIIASMPVLAPERGRRYAKLGAGAWVAALVIGGGAIYAASRAEDAGAMPSQLGVMSDPSLQSVGADWPAYGATYAARRYSPLTQITRENVGDLERAWLYRTGDLPEEDFGAETTPIKIGDTVYLCSARNILIALDATTGRERWRHDPEVSDDYIPYTAACRGVAFHATAQSADGCSERIVEGTLDGRLIAVNARTGARCASFGENGEVSITDGMGEVTPGMVSITSAPTIVRGVIVTGHQVLDGQMRSAPSGVIKAMTRSLANFAGPGT